MGSRSVIAISLWLPWTLPNRQVWSVSPHFEDMWTTSGWKLCEPHWSNLRTGSAVYSVFRLTLLNEALLVGGFRVGGTTWPWLSRGRFWWAGWFFKERKFGSCLMWVLGLQGSEGVRDTLRVNLAEATRQEGLGVALNLSGWIWVCVGVALTPKTSGPLSPSAFGRLLFFPVHLLPSSSITMRPSFSLLCQLSASVTALPEVEVLPRAPGWRGQILDSVPLGSPGAFCLL